MTNLTIITDGESKQFPIKLTLLDLNRAVVKHNISLAEVELYNGLIELLFDFAANGLMRGAKKMGNDVLTHEEYVDLMDEADNSMELFNTIQDTLTSLFDTEGKK